MSGWQGAGGKLYCHRAQQTGCPAPVIDLEYDSNCINAFTKAVTQEIQVMHDQLQQHYGKAAHFLYFKSFYHIVLMGSFVHTPLWVRDYQEQPKLKMDGNGCFGNIPRMAKLMALINQSI